MAGPTEKYGAKWKYQWEDDFHWYSFKELIGVEKTRWKKVKFIFSSCSLLVLLRVMGVRVWLKKGERVGFYGNSFVCRKLFEENMKTKMFEDA